MVFLAGILVTLATLVVIGWPLFNHIAAPLTDGPDRVAELRELYALRDVTYETLRDLEFDFHADKISKQDYTDLSHRFKLEAVDLIGRIEALECSPREGQRPSPDQT